MSETLNLDDFTIPVDAANSVRRWTKKLDDLQQDAFVSIEKKMVALAKQDSPIPSQQTYYASKPIFWQLKALLHGFLDSLKFLVTLKSNKNLLKDNYEKISGEVIHHQTLCELVRIRLLRIEAMISLITTNLSKDSEQELLNENDLIYLQNMNDVAEQATKLTNGFERAYNIILEWSKIKNYYDYRSISQIDIEHPLITTNPSNDNLLSYKLLPNENPENYTLNVICFPGIDRSGGEMGVDQVETKTPLKDVSSDATFDGELGKKAELRELETQIELEKQRLVEAKETFNAFPWQLPASKKVDEISNKVEALYSRIEKLHADMLLYPYTDRSEGEAGGDQAETKTPFNDMASDDFKEAKKYRKPDERPDPSLASDAEPNRPRKQRTLRFSDEEFKILQTNKTAAGFKHLNDYLFEIANRDSIKPK